MTQSRLTDNVNHIDKVGRTKDQGVTPHSYQDPVMTSKVAYQAMID